MKKTVIVMAILTILSVLVAGFASAPLQAGARQREKYTATTAPGLRSSADK